MKYRILPKVLDSLELFDEGKVATIHVDPKWIKETGAHTRDCDDALDMIMSMHIVKVTIFVRVVNNACRVSIRSKEKINVSEVASKFGGGGHINAAGFSVDSVDVNKVRKTVLKELRKEAYLVGANAVIAVDLDYNEFSGGGKSMLFVVASGTAVEVSSDE